MSSPQGKVVSNVKKVKTKNNQASNSLLLYGFLGESCDSFCPIPDCLPSEMFTVLHSFSHMKSAIFICRIGDELEREKFPNPVCCHTSTHIVRLSDSGKFKLLDSPQKVHMRSEANNRSRDSPVNHVVSELCVNNSGSCRAVTASEETSSHGLCTNPHTQLLFLQVKSEQKLKERLSLLSLAEAVDVEINWTVAGCWSHL